MKRKPIKKQTGGKLPMRKPGVSKEKPFMPSSRTPVDIKQGYGLYDNRDYPGDDFELWKKDKKRGYYSKETGKCYDINQKQVPCPKTLQKKRTGGVAKKKCAKCGMTNCKCRQYKK